MSSKTKKMLLLLLVLALLILAYVVLTRPWEQVPNEEQPAEPETETYTVLQVTPETLIAYSYTFDGAEYAYRLTEDATRWLWEGDETLPLDNGEITAMISMVTNVTSTVRYDGVAESALSDYGLADGCVRMTFTFEDGVTQAVRFGKTNVFNGLTYFCREDEPAVVYMVQPYIASVFELTPQQIVQQDELPTFAETQLHALRVTLGERSVLCDYDYPEGEEADAESVRVMTAYEGEGADGRVLEESVAASIVDTLVGLSFGSAATFDPAAWEQYGVGEAPRGELQVFYTYTHKVENSETGATTSTELQTMYRLYLGEWTDDGRVWARLSDCSGVYAVDLSAVLALVGE